MCTCFIKYLSNTEGADSAPWPTSLHVWTGAPPLRLQLCTPGDCCAPACGPAGWSCVRLSHSLGVHIGTACPWCGFGCAAGGERAGRRISHRNYNHRAWPLSGYRCAGLVGSYWQRSWNRVGTCGAWPQCMTWSGSASLT